MQEALELCSRRHLVRAEELRPLSVSLRTQITDPKNGTKYYLAAEVVDALLDARSK